MRRLMMLAATAALLTLPASAADKTPTVADSADTTGAKTADADAEVVQVIATSYPVQVQSTTHVLGLPLTVTLKQPYKDGARFYKVTDPNGAYMGTGTDFLSALKDLQMDYEASGLPDGPLPLSVTADSRAYGTMKSVQANGLGHLKVSRVRLANFPGMTFIIHDWAASYEGATFAVNDYASFQFLPTDKADEVLVVSTDPVSLSDEH